MTRRCVVLCLVGLLLAGAGNPAAAIKCMPISGNWCDIDYPSHDWPQPVDAFDAACIRPDLCTAGTGFAGVCDLVFVAELHGSASQADSLPRPLRWDEYLIRTKAGGPWGGMPVPMPGDALGAMSSLLSPCW